MVKKDPSVCLLFIQMEALFYVPVFLFFFVVTLTDTFVASHTACHPEELDFELLVALTNTNFISV